MKNTIFIPSHAYHYVLLQRTNLCSFLTKKISGLGLPIIYQLLCRIDGFINRKSINNQYSIDIYNDLDTMKAYLPERCNRLIDIGCGVAGIDVLLYNHFGCKPEITLLDKSQLDKNIKYAFRNKSAFYNSLEVAIDLLKRNGVAEKHIKKIDISKENHLKYDKQADLIFSLLSWGFHYPVNTYLEWAYERLRKGGRLIIDIRRDCKYNDVFGAYFHNIQVLFTHSKFYRIGCEK